MIPPEKMGFKVSVRGMRIGLFFFPPAEDSPVLWALASGSAT